MKDFTVDDERRRDILRSADTCGLILYLQDYCIILARRYIRYTGTNMVYVNGDDLIQDALLTVMECLDHAYLSENPFAYLIGVIKNAMALSYHKQRCLITLPRAARAEKRLPLILVTSIHKEQDTLIDSEDLSAPRDYSWLYRLIDQLPEAQREVIYCHYGLGGHSTLTFAEIAARQGKHRTTPRNNWVKAIHNLRKALVNTEVHT
jgi:RNA polymerase sigma factor (sigma-70 family)